MAVSSKSSQSFSPFRANHLFAISTGGRARARSLSLMTGVTTGEDQKWPGIVAERIYLRRKANLVGVQQDRPLGTG